MYVVYASLMRKGTAPQRPGEAAALLDALWAHALEDDGMEHIRIRAGPERIDIIMFMNSASERIAEQCAFHFLGRAHTFSHLISRNYTVRFPEKEQSEDPLTPRNEER
jgi:hypothetical protein